MNSNSGHGSILGWGYGDVLGSRSGNGQPDNVCYDHAMRGDMGGETYTMNTENTPSWMFGDGIGGGAGNTDGTGYDEGER